MVTVLLLSVFTFLFFLEGLICVVFFLPIAVFFAMLGGLLGGTTARYLRNRSARAATLSVAFFLPLLLAGVESRSTPAQQIRTVENTIDINADENTVWRNIIRVPAISRAELPDQWIHRIGFPRPIEATLSNEGLGGVRHATFESDVIFLENVDVWEPNHRLGFSIHPEYIPAHALDEHVTVGGRYFDVLHGEYRIEPLANGRIRLHLTSQQRLSTDFNWYAQLWTDAVMSEIQRGILQVIAERCEAGTVPQK